MFVWVDAPGDQLEKKSNESLRMCAKNSRNAFCHMSVCVPDEALDAKIRTHADIVYERMDGKGSI